MGISSLLSAASVAGQTSIVVCDAEASLRMLQSLQQSEEAAESSYKVNLEALQNQCQIVDDKLEKERAKVGPTENKFEYYRGILEVLQNAMDEKKSLINEKLAQRASISIYGQTDVESNANQAARDAISDQIRALEQELGQMEVQADKLRIHIGEIEQFRKEVEENINTLTESSRQVHQEKDNYQSEGAIAIARIKNDAEQNEHTCQHQHDLAREILSGRQR